MKFNIAKSYKILLAILLAVSMALAGAACGKSDDDPATDAEETTKAAETATVAEQETTTVTEAALDAAETDAAEEASADAAETSATEEAAADSSGAAAASPAPGPTADAPQGINANASNASPAPTASPEAFAAATPAPARQVNTAYMAAKLPEVSLQIPKSEFPIIDGSTATIPLSVAIARAVGGMSQLEAESFIFHSKTSQSIYNLATGYADVLIVYTPPDSVFDDIKDWWGFDKSDILMEPIGRDALVFLVNDQNPVESLTHNELMDIYMGKTKKWSELGSASETGAPAPGASTAAAAIASAAIASATTAANATGETVSDDIIAFQRNKTSGSQVMMENLVMQGAEMADAPGELIVMEMEGLVESVANYNNIGNAIGYSVYYYFKNMYNLEGVRSMDIEGVPCTDETIRDGTYPFTQDFHVMIRRDEPAASGARKLFNLLTGREGPALIAAAGYTPVRGGASPGTDAGFDEDEANSIVIDTLETLRRAPPRSEILGGLLGERQRQNIFPLQINNKFGFVNGDGELVIEPIYDGMYYLDLFDGVDYVSRYYENSPQYYCVSKYKANETGATDRDLREYYAVIGPSGDVVYETYDEKLTLYSINLMDKTLGGYYVDNEYLSAMVFEDGEIIVFESGETPSIELYNGVEDGMGRRILYKGGKMLLVGEKILLEDGTPALINDGEYDEFSGFTDGTFKFKADGRLYAIDASGKTMYEFPEDIGSVRWMAKTGQYFYESAAETEINGKRTTAGGLMGRDFAKITEPLWLYVNPTNGGGSYIVTEPNPDGSWINLSYLTDKSGKRLTDAYYLDSIRNRMYDEYYEYNKITVNEDNERYLAYRPNNAGGVGMASDSVIIDAKGNILHSFDGSVAPEDLYGEFIMMRITGEKGYGISYASGLKTINAPESLDSVENGWIINPYYNWFTTENGGRFMITSVYTKDTGPVQPPSGESKVVFDVVTGETLFKGEFYSLNFFGYKSGGEGGEGGRPPAGAATAGAATANASAPGGTPAAAAMPGVASAAVKPGATKVPAEDAIFYAETALRKGYLNGRGDWIVCVAKYDSLEQDG